MPKPATLPDFILGKKGESHVSGSVNACSLGQMKEIREQIGQLCAKKAQKSRIRLCWVLQRRTMKNKTSSCRARALLLKQQQTQEN